MKTRLILWCCLFIASLFVACGEDSLTPSAPQEFYDFPQGDADYDQEILAYYEEYNVQFLYKYRESDFRWNITEYIPYYSVPGEEAYVGDAFYFVTEDCFSIWPDEFLRQVLPLRVLLASEIYGVSESYKSVWDEEEQIWQSVKVYDTTYYASVYGLNHVTFGYTNDTLDQLLPQGRLNTIGEVTKSLIGYAASRDKIVIPTDFSDLFSTTFGSETPGQWGYNGYGFLEYNKNMDVNYDFGLYVKYMTTMSEEDFKAWALSDSFDVSSEWDQSINNYRRTYLIKQKYEAVLNYFKTTFNIDLHAIGNQVASMYK